MEIKSEKLNLGEIEIDLSSSKLTKKLRAITKHTAALADELDEIDSEENDNGRD